MNREFKFTIKSVLETGEFEGIAAVYENVDLGGDRIVRGALTKSIQSNNGRVPLLADHRIPIGVSLLSDSPEGLGVKAILNLDKEVARDTHSDLKFYAANDVPYGMSIGYEAVKSDREGEVRVLRELKLWETSVTLFPMNPRATVQLVKAREDLDGLTTRIEQVAALIAPKNIDIDTVLAFLCELKAGRKISAETRAKLESAMSEIQALLTEAAVESTSPEGAAEKSEPVQVKDHSALSELLIQAKEAFQWNPTTNNSQSKSN